MASKDLQSGAEEVQFTISTQEGNLGALFCCLYKDEENRYSAFSPYLQLENQRGLCMFFFPEMSIVSDLISDFSYYCTP